MLIAIIRLYTTSLGYINDKWTQITKHIHSAVDSIQSSSR